MLGLRMHKLIGWIQVIVWKFQHRLALSIIIGSLSIFTLPAVSFAATTVLPQNIQLQDSITIRPFNQAKLDNYLADEEYRYDRAYTPASPSLWQRFKQWLFDKFIQALGDENTRSIWTWGIYIISGLVIIYVILKLTKTSIRGLIYGQSQNGRMVFAESEENIHELNFDQLIKEAIANGQYNRAIRLLYLKTLKALTDKQLIDWRINKTNHDYIQELNQREIAPAFRRLTLLFEYICYGDFHLNEREFRNASAEFHHFEQQLQKLSITSTSKPTVTAK